MKPTTHMHERYAKRKELEISSVCVCVSGFTPDVKVWEVCFDKTGNFQEVRRAFELKGHTAGVHSFAFSADSHRSVTMPTIFFDSESDVHR